jgi:serine/threonine protein kinase
VPDVVDAPSAASDGAPQDQPMFGPYRLQKLIGLGGMGEVYRAYDTSRGRVVALKRLPVALAADPTFQARFRSEAALAARLHDPHVIPIHDFGEIDGQLYIDMRLVDGPDLAAVLRDGGPLPPRRAVDVVTQVATALDAAHAAGLVHRDIKPANVLLVRSDTESGTDFVYVADFGIARAVDGSNSGSITSTGTTVGSLDYVAPERFTGGHGDRRADVYALGCVLYEALTARRPFPVEGLPAIVYAHLNTPPPAPTALRPELPDRLDAVVARAMAKDPDDRYQTAGALADAAHRALEGGPEDRVGDAASVPAPAPVPARPATPSSSGGSTFPSRTRNALSVLAAIATAAVLIAAVLTVRTLTLGADPGGFVTEPYGSGGLNPFMPPVTTRPPTAVPPVATGGTVAGGTAGLYGGTLNNASCDPAQMVAFLQQHPDKARAWADVEGIAAADLPSYIGGLTPVVLRADTAVTNHGFLDGAATTLRSVLQAGTAVLVDRFGVPRARCYCGNPLTPPPATTPAGFTGERWSGFSPSTIVTVAPTSAPLTQLTLVDPVSLVVFTRPVGGDGRSDQVQNPTTIPAPGPTASAAPSSPLPLPLPLPPSPTSQPTAVPSSPPTVGVPDAVQGLTSTPHNDSGSNHIETDWRPPADPHGTELVGYQVTAASAAGPFRWRVTAPHLTDTDLGRGCAQNLSYTVRAIGRPPGGGAEVIGAPATVAVPPLMNCTPSVEIESVTPSGPGQVTVTIKCSGSGRGHNNHGTLAIRLDDDEKWTQECTFALGGGAVGSAEYTAVLRDVATGRHQVTATATSLSGTRTTPGVAVTVRG